VMSPKDIDESELFPARPLAPGTVRYAIVPTFGAEAGEGDSPLSALS
jgi:hypothetical protein